MDARLQRRIQRYGWDLAAARYEACWHASLSPAQAALLEAICLQPGEHVLDVACGTGLVALAAAALVGPAGRLTGTDISQRMVARAREAAAQAGKANARFERMDAESLQLPDGSFDVATCALGLMYLPDPEAALREMFRVLRPQGRIGLAVWGARRACGWSSVFPIVDAHVRSEVCPLFFRLGEGEALAAACRAAGFTSVRSTRLQTFIHYGNADAACEAAFEAGPVALAWSRFDAATRESLRASYLDSLLQWPNGTGYRVPGEFVVVTGCRAPAGCETISTVEWTRPMHGRTLQQASADSSAARNQESEMNANKALWEKGDFTKVAAAMRESGEALVQAIGVEPDMMVLDLGCGDGTTALPAARRGAQVLGVDIASNLVAAGNRRAGEARLSNLRFQEGDASDLSGLENGAFDLVISIFGAMFAPRPFDVAREMMRVARRGGRVVMGNWIPGDPTLVAQILKISSAYTPPPPEGFISPMTWGVESNVLERFGAAGVAKEDISCERDTFTFSSPKPPSELADTFRRYYGPTMNAFEAAEKSGKAEALRQELESLFESQNKSADKSRTSIPATYLRVTVQAR